MKIAHIITNLHNGGAEKMAVEFANAQAQLGHQVSLIVFDKLTSEMVQAQFVASNVSIKCIKRYFSFSIGVVLRLFWFLWREKVNVVHTHKPSAVVHTLLAIFCLKRIHFVHTIHNELLYYKSLFQKLNTLAFYRCTVKHVCLTSKMTQDYKYTFPKMSFRCIRNGISILDYSPDNKEVKALYKNIIAKKKLLFIGRNAEQKNLNLLFETIRSFATQDLSLICIGIEKQDILKHYKVQDIIDKQVFICGSRANVGDYLYHADALILSSKNEGMPLVIIEAMSMGVPIISTAVGGVPEMVQEGDNGFLASQLNKASLTAAINRFLAVDHAELNKIADNNRQKYQKVYSLEQSVSQYLSLYRAGINVV